MERVNTTGHINDIPSINDRMREQLSSAGSSQVTQLKKPQKIARRPIFVRSDFSLGRLYHSCFPVYLIEKVFAYCHQLRCSRCSFCAEMTPEAFDMFSYPSSPRSITILCIN